jgi:hypothetical protein
MNVELLKVALTASSRATPTVPLSKTRTFVSVALKAV